MDPNNAAYLALRNHPETTIRPINSTGDMRSPTADTEHSPRNMEDNIFKQVSRSTLSSLCLVTRTDLTLQPQQGMVGFGGIAETKYSAQQGFTQTSQTPPSSGYGGGFNDVLNRYKLEQTIRQLHSFSTTDPRTSFGAPFSGV